MSGLIWVCLSDVIRAHLVWIPVLVGSVALLGIALFVLAHHRFKRFASAHEERASRSHVWTVHLLLIITQVISLPVFALAMAIPFALQQGVADAIEATSPRVFDWGLRTGTQALREQLSITDDNTIVDLGQVAPVLRSLAPVATRAHGFLASLSIVPRLTSNAYFRALDSAVDEVAATGLQVTWDDLIQSAHRHFGAMWTDQTRTVASLLRASSLHFISLLAGATVIVDLLCALVILLLTRSG
jgi:hypothetical protein